MQYAAVTAFEGSPEIDAYLDRCRDIVRGLGAWCANALRETGVRLHDPTGGFYLFADFEPMRERLAERGIRDSRTLCERLLEETGVAVLPSAAFERPADELAIRLAYVDFDGDGPLRAEGRTDDETFLRQHCPRVLEGVDTLCNWLA